MNKFKQLMISFAIVAACGVSAFADTTFTPLNFDDATYTGSTSNNVIASTSSSVQPVVVDNDLIGNKKMQSAISALDNAQVEVRNELLNYRTQYAETDAKYIKIKAERSALSKQVKATEKRIKEIDRAKEKIKKNMM